MRLSSRKDKGSDSKSITYKKQHARSKIRETEYKQQDMGNSLAPLVYAFWF